MPAKPKAPQTIEAIRRALAKAEATAGALAAKLAKAEAAATGAPVPLTGLDLLWQAALPMSRSRSSQHRCRKAWAAIPKAQRPTIGVAVAALKAWNRCDLWRKDDNSYAPGLQRFISDRMWESLPEKSKADPLARYRTTQQPRAAQKPEDLVTDDAEISRLLGLAPRAAAKPANNIHGPAEMADMLKFQDT